MKPKLSSVLCLGVAMALGLAAIQAKAQLPPDFPSFTVTTFDTNAVGNGYIFLSVTDTATNGYYVMILKNDGTPVWYQQVSTNIYDFKMLPDGFLHYAPFLHTHSWTGGGDVTHTLLDPSYNLTETITAGNDYVAEGHDFQLLPNGHVLLLGYYKSQMDLSQIVPGGYPNALVAGAVIQELNSERNVVWQWRSWDHYTFENYYAPVLNTMPLARNPVVDSFHLNTVILDDDENLLISNFMMDVQKINRQTGEVMWRLGGLGNQFTFSNVNSNLALTHFSGHTLSRLPNGNLLIYCNADQQATRSSKVYEYSLDEVNKVATLVWSYAPPTNTPYYAWHYGSAQRLANGNTFIGWGGANIMPGIGGVTNQAIPACTEVTPAGQVVFEMKFDDARVSSYRAYRFEWPPTNNLQAVERELTAGNDYSFTNPANTGVSMEVISGGGGYNSCFVTREPYAPVTPVFLDTVPQVLPVRVKLSESSIPELNAVISFDASSFDFRQPANLTVYYRPQADQGIFTAQPTAYNPVTHQVQTTLTLLSAGGDFGEFIFCYPDVTPVAYPPLLNQVENYRGVQPYETIAPLLATGATPYPVNQELPVSLSWSPKGFAVFYELEIATTADFASPMVTEPYLATASYVWSNAAPSTTYYYHVRTWNDSTNSDWSVGSFQTVAPMLQVTAPNGGEMWQRGLKYFVQWNDNITENVVIDLYKSGVFLKSLATNASTGAYKWTVGLDLVPGNDYSIRVSSATNAALFATSASNFDIGDMVPVVVATDPAGLTVSVDGTNYTAPASFNWLSGSSHSLNTSSPQLAGDGHSRSVFATWNDAGLQSHSIVVPSSGTNYTASFSTQYLLDTTVSPTGAGTISNYPAGPWYDAGQLISLTAKTNAGYRINFWQGADSALTNTAQVTMNDYHLVQANFIVSDYPYLIVTNSSGVAPGNLIGNIAGRTGDGTKVYYVVLDNTGTNLLYANKTNVLLRFVTPQGLVTATDSSGFRFKDETLTNIVGTSKTLGYTLDTHDVKLFPNGHSLVFGSEVRTFDMSTIVPGGKTAASVTGDIIQELDASNRLVFEWHTFDHVAITNTFADMTQASFDYAHVNAMTTDPTDDNLLASLRTTSEIVKIDRRTGEIIWRLGGKMNQFTFIGEHAENAPFYTVGQHDVHRLANGHLLYFDNGNISGGGVTPNDRTYSRVVEYALDELNKTATLVWEYRHSPDISASCTGSIKRFANGNTLIDWGCAVPTSGTIITEVNPAGQVVFEMKHRQTGGIGSVLLGGGLTKQVWNSPDLVRSATYQGIQSGQTYTALAAGVAVTVNNLSGPADNALAIQRYLDAVRFPQFSGKAPQVVIEHVVLSGSNIVSLEAELDLSLPDTSSVFDTPMIHDPAQVVVYQRSVPGQGAFAALPTTYDAGTQKLRVTTTQLGEFIFGYPDLAETPYVPVVLSPADQSTVNQAAPVVLSWVPQGLIGSFDLQVATDAGFASLVVDTNGLGSTTYTLPSVLPNTQYFWRVRCINQGGTSAWASASFTTVPPILQLTYPAGGEVWQRFQVVTIRWIDNLAENVALDIYKGGLSNRTIAASISSSGAYTWTVGQFQAFPSGSDYTMKIRSTLNPALYSFSGPFSLITNLTTVTIDPRSVTILPDRRAQFTISVPGAVGATVLGSTNLMNWDVLQNVPLTNGSAVFTDNSSTNIPARYYRLRVP